MQIVVNYDQSQSSLPAGFVADVNYVVQTFDALFTNKVILTINVGYGEINGQALQSGALAESEASNYYAVSYSSVRNALIAESAPGAATLPATSPFAGTLAVSQGEATALGLYPNNGSLDGYVGFDSAANIFSYAINTTPPAGEYYFVGVLEHELTEDMGRVSLLNDQPSYYAPPDLYRYSSPGVRDLLTGGSGSTAYFSVDGGNTNLGTWNNNTNNGDLGDWYPSGPATGGYDAFNDYGTRGVVEQLSASDIALMEALGWTTSGSQFPGATLGALAGGPSLLTEGDVENNSTMDLVWRTPDAQTTVWAVNTSGAVSTANLGLIGTAWAILGSGNYLSGTTTQMLTDWTTDGTMTLWWVNNGILTGINLGQDWQNISYVASGNFTNFGSDDILVRNQIDNHMYVWWVSSNTLQGIDLGAYWGNISFIAAGTFYQSGESNMLVKNLVDDHMYDWWIDPTSHVLGGIDLGAYLTTNQVVATGNFLANGADDMLVQNTSDNHMYLWWISNGTLQGIDLGAYWANIQFLAAGHFAGSGDEMLVQNKVDGHVYMWWVSTSTNALTGVDLGPVSTQWQIAALADYNRDGYTDIVWQNTATGQVNLWQMGSYALPTNTALASSPAAAISSGFAANASPSSASNALTPLGNFPSSTALSANDNGSLNYTPYFGGSAAGNSWHAASNGGAVDPTGQGGQLLGFDSYHSPSKP